jgi:hypothetical protein
MLIFAVRFAISRSAVTTVALLVLDRVSGGDNVAELEDEFEPEFDTSFAAESVVRTVAGVLTFV